MSTSERAQSDFKKLKAKYNSQLSTLKELFTEWTEEDLLFTLQDADGDLELAIDRISEGHANQWGEVKTKKSKKEAAAAAAANKVSSESSTLNTSTAAPSYPTSFNNRSTTYNSRPSVHQKPHPRSSTTSTPRHKPTTTNSSIGAVSWQSKKPSTTNSDFSGDGWNTTTTDSWGSGEDAWKPKKLNSNSNNDNRSSNSSNNTWLETPKKATSTSSSSTKTSNAGVAKTWASLLQTKEEPIKEAEAVAPVKEKEHKLQKVDDAWLTPATNITSTSTTVNSLSQWDQPLQLPVKEKEESLQKTTLPNIEDEKHDISVDFNSLSLEENVPKANNASSSHPSVADILNSVKQQPATSTATSTTNTNSSSANDNTNKLNVSEHAEPQSTQNVDNQPQLQQALYQQQQQQQYQQQQQFQQQQYQQFGIQDFNSPINANYNAYGNERSTGNYYNPQQQKFATNNKQEGGNKSALDGQSHQQDSQFPQMYNNNMQQQQSFYPYYYMPNQFNAYSPYGQHQQANNSFMGGRNSMYPTSVYGQQQPKTMGTPTTSTAATADISSPYASSSPYNPSQQLYGGFNSTSQFDDFSSNQFYGQQQFLSSQQQQQPQQQDGSSPEKTNKSPQNHQQQAYGNNYFGQSPMFSYQQQQQYRNNGHQQYWNQ